MMWKKLTVAAALALMAAVGARAQRTVTATGAAAILNKDTDTDTMRAAYSPPCPSNKVTASSGPRRRTRAAWRAALSGSLTMPPAASGSGQKKRRESIVLL